jgi:hypothetical protein
MGEVLHDNGRLLLKNGIVMVENTFFELLCCIICHVANVGQSVNEAKNFRNFIDKFVLYCYSMASDRVAETCEARDRGRTCGSLPFLH